MTPRSRHDPGPAALIALAEKYRTLLALRRAKARGEPEPPAALFRTLAQRFPGALRELDTVALSELEARATALEQAAGEPAAFAPWMGWMHGYHAWMRAALVLKPRLARKPVPAPEVAAHLAGELAARTGLAVEPAFVCAVAAPPAGRLRPIVLAQLAREQEVPLEHLVAVLFPARVPTAAA
jgi:hypothetical protein